MRLMRFDKPMGTVLLWVPTACALWLANEGLPNLRLFAIFLLGTIVMRAAGCIINDVADRHVDGHVERTKQRPLVSGEVGLIPALCLFVGLLCVALYLVLQLPIVCFYLSCLSLIVTIVYPFCKRFLAAPQLVLGIAFSMGIPMAFFASGVKFEIVAWLLFILNFFWIIAYDTMYAMADKQDDLQLGVRSTAVLFAENDRLIIGLLQTTVHFLWLFIADQAHLKMQFYLFWLAAGFIFLHQQKLLGDNTPGSCFKGFITSGWYGLIIWVGIMLSY